jgi:hypothetical protein
MPQHEGSPTTQVVKWRLVLKNQVVRLVSENRESWIKIKMGRDSILGSHWSVSPGWLATNVNSSAAICDQKILAFVLQMENSKQSMLMR